MLVEFLCLLCSQHSVFVWSQVSCISAHVGSWKLDRWWHPVAHTKHNDWKAWGAEYHLSCLKWSSGKTLSPYVLSEAIGEGQILLWLDSCKSTDFKRGMCRTNIHRHIRLILDTHGLLQYNSEGNFHLIHTLENARFWMFSDGFNNTLSSSNVSQMLIKAEETINISSN